MNRFRIKPPAANPFDVVSNPKAETEQIKQVADLTVKLLDARYPAPTPILRAVHPKSHGCVMARFSVNRDLPSQYQVGLFAKPGRDFRAWIRYSNASVRSGPDTEPDGKHGSRGMAVKVLGAGDETLLEDRGRVTQDFLMINQPAFAFANQSDYLKFTQILLDNNDVGAKFFAPLAKRPDGMSEEEFQRVRASFVEIQKLQAVPVANPLEVQYFSAAPFLFGPDRVMKFSARPKGPLKPQVVPANPPPDYLRAALKQTIDSGKDVEFDFMLQVRGAGEPDLGIDNASSVWEEAKFPFVPVATISIRAPQEIVDSPRGIEICEGSMFSPWHSLPEHQPVGSINRLRRQVYLASKDYRGAEAEDPRGPSGRGRGQRIREFIEKLMEDRKDAGPGGPRR